MATLTIRNVEDETIRKLKDLARENRRSVEAELRIMIDRHISHPTVAELLAESDRLLAMTTGKPKKTSLEHLHDTRREQSL